MVGKASADGAKAEKGRGEGGGEWAKEVIKKILEKKDDGVRCGVEIFVDYTSTLVH
jgi:hypothetical protein